MFTGIITDCGRVRRVIRKPDQETRFEISSHYDLGDVSIGASIAHNGVCLTVVEKEDNWYAVEVSAETLSCTTLNQWQEGTAVNLERALKVGDELGGHIVSGHVDGLAELVSKISDGESIRLEFAVPSALAPFIAPKGSVALDGISLTVNSVQGRHFGVNIIPHTQEVTTFGQLAVGDKVNLEIDMLARYVARLLEKPE